MANVPGGGAYLQTLTSAELRDLLRAMPELAESWAGVTGMDAGLLGEGDPQALTVLRTAAVSCGPRLFSELARAGVGRVLTALDTAEADRDLPEGPREFAAVAGKQFGAAGPLFLAAVAAGDDAISVEVASQLTELQDIAVSNASSSEAPAEDLAALGTHRLDNQVTPAQTEVEQRERSLQEALRGAGVLHEQGLDVLIPGMLQAAGFGNYPDWRAAIGAAPTDSGDTVLAEVETAREERASESEPEVQSDPRPEPGLQQPVPLSSLMVPSGVENARAIAPPARDVLDFGEVPAADVITEADEGPVADTLVSPWDGAPSLIAMLIGNGNEARAVCMAQAANEHPMRQRLLKFFCGAFSCSPLALELQLPELSPPDAEVNEMGADEARLLLATALRVGLTVGYSTVGLSSLIERAELGQGGIRILADTAADVIQRGYRRATGSAIMQQADLAKDWAAFGSRAEELQERLAHSTVVLPRATHVLHHLVRKDQPVGLALALVPELAALGMGTAIAEVHGDKWSHIEQIAADLSNGAARDRMITDADQAVSTRTQLRKRIVGGALTKLDSALCEVGSFLASLLAARSAIRVSTQGDLRSADALVHALDDLTEGGQPSSVGDTALYRLTSWLRGGARSTSAESVSILVREELEPLYEIPRDMDGSPTRPPTLAEAAELLSGRDRLSVVRGYLEAGNITAARAIAMTADEADQTALDDEIQRGTQRARVRHAQARDKVDRTAARLLAINDDNGSRDLAVKADKLREPPDGRFDLIIGALQELAEAGADRLRTYRSELSERTRRCKCDEPDRQRILDLIEREDEIVAVEFLTMAEAGQRLPDADEQHGNDFSAFFPGTVNVAVAAAREQKDVISAIRTAAGVSGIPSNRQLSYGLEAWRELKRRKRGVPDRFRERVADVLRMIGLVPRAQNRLQEISRTQRSGYATFRVRATPVDRSYVPSLGTQANSDYDLTLVWDAVTPTRLLDFIDEKRRTRANIVIYFNTLDPEQRLQLRRLTSHNGGKGFSPVVIDDAVAGWLSTLAEPGWRFVQRVTLPFTTINPYTPFAGGEVPEEVFVGRAQEREQIESPTGSMFVYGGRQLGKSAVLRRVERMFTDDWEPPKDTQWQPRTGRVAVYLDLKAASIGEAQEPAALWTVLAERLRDAKVLPPSSRDRIVGPDKVIQQLSGWLNADDGNRLLLLLDEADNFLTADSQARSSGAKAEFPTLQRLKGLMETSGRRFKAVFAGLHQVQRFHDSSNTPVAHGGDDILIGPLATMDAFHLVVDPMTALGYQFASPDLVWRLLLFANYQASLVQIVCEALVRELSRRQLAADGGRILITAADVESVIAKREVRNLIVQRFWWTINLDPRYRVIALVVAVRSLDSDPGETFTAEDLHEFCELYWPKGFAGGQLRSKEFLRYLEEMVGLGVLYRQGDQYGLRSPNILGLLGTRQALEQSLDDAPRDLEIPYEYNTSLNRRIIGRSTELWAPRSPLTDRDIARLLNLDGQRHGQVQIVTGSSALTVDRAARVILDAAEEQQIRCELLAPDELATAIRIRDRHIVIDMSGTSTSTPMGSHALPALYAKLAGLNRVTATIVVGPASLPLRLEGIDSADITPLRRWSVEGLRSWHESPFYTPDLRTRLYRVTSGWPLLIEETMHQITNGKSPEDALDLIVERLADQNFARDFLTTCGIDLGLAVRWGAEFAVVGDDGLDQAFPASLAELSEALGADARPIIERLEALDGAECTPDGWELDRAVHAAAASLRG